MKQLHELIHMCSKGWVSPIPDSGSLGHKRGMEGSMNDSRQISSTGETVQRPYALMGQLVPRDSHGVYQRQGLGLLENIHCLTSIEEEWLLIHFLEGNRIGGALLALSSIVLTRICFAFSSFPQIDPCVWIMKHKNGRKEVSYRTF